MARLAAVLHVVFTGLFVAVVVFVAWFSAYVVYRLCEGRA